MAQGRQEALTQLYDITSAAVNGLLLRILVRPPDAEEVLLDVYMKAWKNASSYAPARGSVECWLLMMARSIAIDRLRQKRSQMRTIVSEPEHAPEPASPEASPEEQTARGQWRTRILAVLSELPPDQREAIELAFFGGFSHAELASRLGQPLGTIKSRIRTALLHLRKLLNEPVAS